MSLSYYVHANLILILVFIYLGEFRKISLNRSTFVEQIRRIVDMQLLTYVCLYKHRNGHSNCWFSSTVVPVMNGHPRDEAKVSVHCRWPLVTGTDGQAGDAKYNTPCNTTYTTITTSDIPNEYTHCHNYVCYSSKHKSNAT